MRPLLLAMLLAGCAAPKPDDGCPCPGAVRREETQLCGYPGPDYQTCSHGGAWAVTCVTPCGSQIAFWDVLPCDANMGPLIAIDWHAALVACHETPSLTGSSGGSQ